MSLSVEQSDDLLNLIAGRKIGEGQYREVFECHLNKKWVIKLDTRKNFSNIAEWETWSELGETALGKWMAPVEWLSPGGFWLIQQKTEPLTKDRRPKRVPEIFADMKLSNWGWLNGRAVCHDFGNHRAYTLARKPGGKLIGASWHD